MEIQGYKIAMEINNKFYSPFTGIEYKLGDLPFLNYKQITEKKIKLLESRTNRKRTYHSLLSYIDPLGVMHIPEYVNNTGIYSLRKAIKEKFENEVILKVYLIYYCSYRPLGIELGNHFLYIEKIKQY